MNPFHYQRNLPHILPPGATLFVTFRLAASLPLEVLLRLREEFALDASEGDAPNAQLSYTRQCQYFGRFDALLDGRVSGPTWLRDPAIAAIVAQSLRYFDGKAYDLCCYCLMPNHVHLVVQLSEKSPPFMRTLQSIKAHTAREANRHLSRSGQFWHRESYDHVVRDGAELQRTISYIVENPVKAGLCADWQEWPHTYWRP